MCVDISKRGGELGVCSVVSLARARFLSYSMLQHEMQIPAGIGTHELCRIDCMKKIWYVDGHFNIRIPSLHVMHLISTHCAT